MKEELINRIFFAIILFNTLVLIFLYAANNPNNYNVSPCLIKNKEMRVDSVAGNLHFPNFHEGEEDCFPCTLYNVNWP